MIQIHPKTVTTQYYQIYIYSPCKQRLNKNKPSTMKNRYACKFLLSQKIESRKQADSSEACRKAKVCLLYFPFKNSVVAPA